MLLQVSGDGLDYLADLGLWDLDYERGLHTTREPQGIEAEDHMILKLYDQVSTTMNQDGTPTGKQWEPRSDNYFTDQVPDPDTRAAMRKTIRRLYEAGYLENVEGGVII